MCYNEGDADNDKFLKSKWNYVTEFGNRKPTFSRSTWDVFEYLGKLTGLTKIKKYYLDNNPFPLLHWENAVWNDKNGQMLDELNELIDDLSPQLASELYRQSKNMAQLAELSRQEKFFTEMKNEMGKTSDDDFKKKPVNSFMPIQTERLSIVSSDGDGNLRTDEGSGINICANNMKVEGVLDDNGSLDKGNRLSVNMKTIDLSTAGKSGVEKEEDGTLKAAKLPAEGDVIITSKNITLQTINAEVADKKYKDTGLVEGGSVNIRSKSIGLSNINTTDVEADDKGKVTKATYKPDGEILLFSNQVQISGMESKLDGDKLEETALAKDSVFSVRA